MRLLRRVLCVGMCLAFCAASSYAADAIKVTVKGQIKFERRSTVVPQMVCADGVPCFKSKPYWVMMLHDDGIRYEMSRTYGLGSETPPVSVEVSGVQIREGSHVRLVGEVESVAEDYAIVTAVEDIELLSPFGRPAYKTAEVFPARVNGGWICRSNSGSVPEYRVNLWYGVGPSSTSPQQFRMSLEARQSSDEEFRPMALYNDLTQRVYKRELVFDGTASNQSVALKILQSSSSIFNLPGWFSLSPLGSGRGRFPEELLLELNCSQSQLF